MIGFYDYTVILTYLSAISASIGILVSTCGSGHPYAGVFFLLISGFCDAFDGKVARTKKRTERAKKFGIQIDSLADFAAFGLTPAIMVFSMMCHIDPHLIELFDKNINSTGKIIISILSFSVLMFYIIAALIRLAYYNVTEEERQSVESGNRKYYEGLPVTSSSLIFPALFIIQFFVKKNLTLIFLIVMLIIGFLFISKIKIPKPKMRGILIMVAIGLLEFTILVLIFTQTI